MAASAALGAFIGYFTNALAIRSLFRPLEPRWYTLGWQGVIPRNRARLADNVAKVVGEDLLYREYLVEQIERPALQESLRQVLDARLGRLLDETPAKALDWLPAGGGRITGRTSVGAIGGVEPGRGVAGAQTRTVRCT